MFRRTFHHRHDCVNRTYSHFAVRSGRDGEHRLQKPEEETGQ